MNLTSIKLVQFVIGNTLIYRYKTLYLLFLPLSISCNSSQVTNSVEIRGIISEDWIGRQIHLSDSLLVLCGNTLKNTHYKDLFSKRYTILSLVSNSECAKCDYIKFNAYKDFLEKLEPYYYVGFMVIYCGYNEYFKRIVYPEIVYPGPIILDRECEFALRNEIPDYESFNTMLLDKNNRILLFGDLIHLAETERQFMKTIAEMK